MVEGRMRIAIILATAATGLLSTSCVLVMPDRIHYTLDGSKNPAIGDQACSDAAVIGERMFGVALSGGGSRAAVYAAAGFEALWEHGLLDQITHVSSVSGGSMASSFLVTNKPTCDRLTDEAERDLCWRAFFADFQDAMRRNYINRAELRQLMPNRTLSPTRRALSMQEEFDKWFLHGKTFSEIEAGRESDAQPSRPVLLINGTSYDAGRRFVFANTCLIESAPPTSGDGGSRSQAAAHAALQRDGLRAMSFSTDGCARPVPGDFPVSLAVTASAAFPGLMGPVTIQAPDACESGDTHWWHLGDGGIIENTGIDTLQELVLRDRAVGGDLDRVFLLSLDAGRKIATGERQALRTTDMWTSPDGIATVVAAPRTVARAYHERFWQDMQATLAEDGVDFDSIVLEYTAANLDRWPESCPNRAQPPSRDDFRGIKTDLQISTCHADLVALAAHEIVHEQLNGAAGRRLEELGIPVRRVEE